jgi:hypothetical protein
VIHGLFYFFKKIKLNNNSFGVITILKKFQKKNQKKKIKIKKKRFYFLFFRHQQNIHKEKNKLFF